MKHYTNNRLSNRLIELLELRLLLTRNNIPNPLLVKRTNNLTQLVIYRATNSILKSQLYKFKGTIMKHLNELLPKSYLESEYYNSYDHSLNNGFKLRYYKTVDQWDLIFNNTILISNCTPDSLAKYFKLLNKANVFVN